MKFTTGDNLKNNNLKQQTYGILTQPKHYLFVIRSILALVLESLTHVTFSYISVKGSWSTGVITCHPVHLETMRLVHVKTVSICPKLFCLDTQPTLSNSDKPE